MPIDAVAGAPYVPPPLSLIREYGFRFSEEIVLKPTIPNRQ
jgi:hypothetical protein